MLSCVVCAVFQSARRRRARHGFFLSEQNAGARGRDGTRRARGHGRHDGAGAERLANVLLGRERSPARRVSLFWGGVTCASLSLRERERERERESERKTVCPHRLRVPGAPQRSPRCGAAVLRAGRGRAHAQGLQGRLEARRPLRKYDASRKRKTRAFLSREGDARRRRERTLWVSKPRRVSQADAERRCCALARATAEKTLLFVQETLSLERERERERDERWS